MCVVYILVIRSASLGDCSFSLLTTGHSCDTMLMLGKMHIRAYYHNMEYHSITTAPSLSTLNSKFYRGNFLGFFIAHLQSKFRFVALAREMHNAECKEQNESTNKTYPFPSFIKPHIPLYCVHSAKAEMQAALTTYGLGVARGTHLAR